MNASNRNPLAIALAAVLLSPAAWAQQGAGKGPPDVPRTLPTQTPVPNSPEQTMREVGKPVATTTGQADTRPPPSPPQSQGSGHAAAHSSVVQRDLWTKLDTDGDGRISTTEGALDTDFDSESMDADRDGYVTDVEYRAAAKDDMDTGRDGRDTSPRAPSSMGDAMRRLDANADGSISLSESDADAAIRSNFSAMDADSNGLVTRAEYRAWLKASRK